MLLKMQHLVETRFTHIEAYQQGLFSGNSKYTGQVEGGKGFAFTRHGGGNSDDGAGGIAHHVIESGTNAPESLRDDGFGVLVDHIAVFLVVVDDVTNNRYSGDALDVFGGVNLVVQQLTNQQEECGQQETNQQCFLPVAVDRRRDLSHRSRRLQYAVVGGVGSFLDLCLTALS